jgi:hypothetical protein
MPGTNQTAKKYARINIISHLLLCIRSKTPPIKRLATGEPFSKNTNPIQCQQIETCKSATSMCNGVANGFWENGFVSLPPQEEVSHPP